MNDKLHPELEPVLNFFREQVKSPSKDFSYASGLIAGPSFFPLYLSRTC